MAPEQARGECIALSDMWAFGMMLIELATGQQPFAAISSGMAPLVFIRRLGKSEDMVPPVPNGLPEELREVVVKCLVREAAKRPPAQELLSMPYFL